MNKVIISDTSCLIALSRINKLEILHQLFRNIFITPEVRKEYSADLPGWVTIMAPISSEKQIELEMQLDKGEASAIALAIEMQNSVLIIDEKKGRAVAQQLNLEVIGTLKILVLAKQRNHITSVASLVSELEKNGFRFSVSIVQDLLKEAGE